MAKAKASGSSSRTASSASSKASKKAAAASSSSSGAGLAEAAARRGDDEARDPPPSPGSTKRSGGGGRRDPSPRSEGGRPLVSISEAAAAKAASKAAGGAGRGGSRGGGGPPKRSQRSTKGKKPAKLQFSEHLDAAPSSSIDLAAPSFDVGNLGVGPSTSFGNLSALGLGQSHEGLDEATITANNATPTSRSGRGGGGGFDRDVGEASGANGLTSQLPMSELEVDNPSWDLLNQDSFGFNLLDNQGSLSFDIGDHKIRMVEGINPDSGRKEGSHKKGGGSFDKDRSKGSMDLTSAVTDSLDDTPKKNGESMDWSVHGSGGGGKLHPPDHGHWIPPHTPPRHHDDGYVHRHRYHDHHHHPPVPPPQLPESRSDHHGYYGEHDHPEARDGTYEDPFKYAFGDPAAGSSPPSKRGNAESKGSRSKTGARANGGRSSGGGGAGRSSSSSNDRTSKKRKQHHHPLLPIKQRTRSEPSCEPLDARDSPPPLPTVGSAPVASARHGSKRSRGGGGSSGRGRDKGRGREGSSPRRGGGRGGVGGVGACRSSSHPDLSQSGRSSTWHGAPTSAGPHHPPPHGARGPPPMPPPHPPHPHAHHGYPPHHPFPPPPHPSADPIHSAFLPPVPSQPPAPPTGSPYGGGGGGGGNGGGEGSSGGSSPPREVYITTKGSKGGGAPGGAPAPPPPPPPPPPGYPFGMPPHPMYGYPPAPPAARRPAPSNPTEIKPGASKTKKQTTPTTVAPIPRAPPKAPQTGVALLTLPNGAVLTRAQAPGIGWPPEEDLHLAEVMASHKSTQVDWDRLRAEHGTGRTARECHDRWTRYLKPGSRKGQWREEEDAIVLRAIFATGTGHAAVAGGGGAGLDPTPPFTQWADLAPQLPGRTGKQIRDRWVNYLNPAINHLPFSREDDLRLWNGHKELGKRWVEISVKVFHSTRSENHIKNRWYSAAFKKFIAKEFGMDAYVDAKQAQGGVVGSVAAAHQLPPGGPGSAGPPVPPPLPAPSPHGPPSAASSPHHGPRGPPPHAQAHQRAGPAVHAPPGPGPMAYPPLPPPHHHPGARHRPPPPGHPGHRRPPHPHGGPSHRPPPPHPHHPSAGRGGMIGLNHAA